ncbi:MAG: hypothetical protein V2A72_00085 [Candidatus Omnitrophota bacterium]
MQTMNLKRIIAREGLILIAIAIFGLAIYFLSKHLNDVYLNQHLEARLKIVENMQYALVGYTPYLKTMSVGLKIAACGYPVIAALRFIIWAIKTLKEKAG